MNVFLQSLVSGIAVGAVYGLIALGFNIIFSTTRVVNFAQGEFVMIGALVGYTLMVGLSLPLPLVIIAMIPILGLVGAATERLVMEPVRRSGYRYAWIITTLATAIVLRNVMAIPYGREDYRFPALVEGTFRLGSAVVAYQQVVIVIAAILLMLLIELVTRRTFFGKAIRATAFNYDVASLMAIPVPLMISASFALSAIISGIAGILIAPIVFANVSMGLLIGLKGFVAIIIGGMGSPKGAILGGLAVGLLDTTVRSLVPGGWGNFIVFAALALMLLVRPTGLAGQKLADAH